MEKLPSGLTGAQAADSLKRYGPNDLRSEDSLRILNLLFEQYKNFMTAVLLVAVIFSIFIGEYVDAFFIFFILAFNGVFGFIQQFRAEKTLEKLKDLSSQQAHVIRDGQELEIDARSLVVGDILSLREGDKIPADGKLLHTGLLEIDESAMTGESMPIEKNKGDVVYSGTFVLRGRNLVEITEIGYQTKIGKIAQELEETERPKTPLAENLDSLGKMLVLIGVILGITLIPVGFFQGRALPELILTAINIAVAMIPEGMPLVVTIALAFGAYKMARQKSIVRKMAAIETLGATTVILTDKTGTLTQNKMVVRDHWVHGDEKLHTFLRACILGNTASFVKEEDHTSEMVGDKTDGALLLFAEEMAGDLEKLKDGGNLISERPFDPDTKLISVVWEEHGHRTEFTRGAPETIFELTKTGKTNSGYKAYQKMLDDGLRVIAFCQKKGTKKPTLLGIAGIYDAPRAEAGEAVRQADAAGIRVVMVTGDNEKTALHVAEEIGMIKKREAVIDSEQLEEMTDEELLKVLPKVRIFARMKPEDKARLVRAYKSAGYVVAVTGDGVNDALALSQANIGVSMGEGGTDVAKEAADIVITDNNLTTIIKAVEEGRGIFENIIKVVVFLISSNISEFLLIFFGILLGLPIPLSVTQILWVNLLGDSLPALALATDTRRHNLLLKKPRNILENIINMERILQILKITIPFVAVLILIYYAALQSVIPNEARFIVFNALVVGEMIIVFWVRGGIRPFSKLLWLSVVATLLLQALTIVNPFLRNLLS